MILSITGYFAIKIILLSILICLMGIVSIMMYFSNPNRRRPMNESELNKHINKQRKINE